MHKKIARKRETEARQQYRRSGQEQLSRERPAFLQCGRSYRQAHAHACPESRAKGNGQLGQNERCGHGIGMTRARAAKLEEPRIEAAMQETESIDIGRAWANG